MKTLTASLLVLLNALPLAAQKRINLFRAIVTTADGQRIDGILHSLSDSALLYVPNTPEHIGRLQTGQPQVLRVPAQQIDKLVIRRKGHVGRAALIGTGLGTLLGIGIAVFTRPLTPVGRFDIFTPLHNAVRVLSIVSAPLGGAQYGALVSIIPRKRVRLRQQPERWRAARPAVEVFSYRHQELRLRGTSNPSDMLYQ